MPEPEVPTTPNVSPARMSSDKSLMVGGISG
ncbi:Uncharacterised protein [Vibrio cholerae]|nr:Uncharacterised protein [Vibrio cholerae]